MNVKISHVVLWVWEIFKIAIVDIMFKNFQFDFKAFVLSNISSIVLQTLVIWGPSHLNAMKIFKRTSIYKCMHHIVLEMTSFHSSKINEFHPN
jgi:hypothetical protein